MGAFRIEIVYRDAVRERRVPGRRLVDAVIAAFELVKQLERPDRVDEDVAQQVNGYEGDRLVFVVGVLTSTEGDQCA